MPIRRERRRNTERRVTNVSMFNLLFVGNRAVDGAAIANEGAVFAVSNATAVNNTSTAGAIISGKATSGSIRNVLTWSNSALQAINVPGGVSAQNNQLEGSGGNPLIAHARCRGWGLDHTARQRLWRPERPKGLACDRRR